MKILYSLLLIFAIFFSHSKAAEAPQPEKKIESEIGRFDQEELLKRYQSLKTDNERQLFAFGLINLMFTQPFRDIFKREHIAFKRKINELEKEKQVKELYDQIEAVLTKKSRENLEKLEGKSISQWALADNSYKYLNVFPLYSKVYIDLEINKLLPEGDIVLPSVDFVDKKFKELISGGKSGKIT